MSEKQKAPRRLIPRDLGGSIKLAEGTGGIITMCPCERFLEVYKVDTTFRIETPETIDPDRTNPNAPMVATVADRIGSAHPIVARVLLQGREILTSVILRATVNEAAVIESLHSVKEALVACHKASEHLSQHLKTADEKWATSQRPERVISSLPQVPELDVVATQFLISAKRAIAGICGLVPHFLVVERPDSNFDRLGDRMEKLLGATAPITTFIRKYADSSRYLIELRNGQEHPKLGKATVIQNVRVQADGSVAAPVWFVTGEIPRPIHAEMSAAIDTMIEMAELMLILLVDECLDKRWPFVVEELPPSERNANMPVKYKVTVDTSRLRTDKPGPIR